MRSFGVRVTFAIREVEIMDVRMGRYDSGIEP
jgi:hypothetical protein